MPTFLTSRYSDALHYAAIAHAHQVRKGTDVTYLAHLLGVSSLVLDYGGTEDEAIAGLLHDVVEDCGAEHEAIVRQRFGDAVADIVMACTDGSQEEKAAAQTPEQQRANWTQRKQAYLAHLAHQTRATLLVSCCDKLHNARAIVSDAEGAAGLHVFTRFKAGMQGTLWYYRSLADRFVDLGVEPAAELSRTVGRMQALAQRET